MRYRLLGRSGIEVSVVGVGTWQFGGEWGQEFTVAEVGRILGRARDLGINLVDTAECYGDHLSERLIGRAIAGSRHEWVVATKFGHQFHPERREQPLWSLADVRSDRWRPEDVVAQLDASLRALRTDYVDVLQFHSGGDEAFATPGLWEALRQQVDAGKVRTLGISLGASDNVLQAGRATAVGASVVQVTYNRLDRAAEGGVFDVCGHQDLGVLVREPLANGYLSGKYAPGDEITQADDWRSRHDRGEVQRKLAAVEDIARAELPSGMAMAPWALAWALRHPQVSAVVAGCRSTEHVEGNARAADLELVADDHPRAVASR